MMNKKTLVTLMLIFGFTNCLCMNERESLCDSQENRIRQIKELQQEGKRLASEYITARKNKNNAKIREIGERQRDICDEIDVLSRKQITPRPRTPTSHLTLNAPATNCLQRMLACCCPWCFGRK